MGTWNSTSFGNDAAISWLQEMLEADGWPLVDETLNSVLGAGNSSIEEETGQEAIAACEVIAWLLGHGDDTDEFDELDSLEEWVLNQEIEIGPDWIAKAKRTIDRIYNAPSELRESYEEADEIEEWAHQLEELKRRLTEGLE